MALGLGVKSSSSPVSPIPGAAPSKPLLGHASPHALTARLRVPSDASPTKKPVRSATESSISATATPRKPADFSSWPEYLRIQHNAKTAIYESPRHGDINLRLATPAQPSLGAHYVWDTSLMMAEFISEETAEWGVEGKSVLELGTGTGFAGIIATLCGAKEVVATDYPDSRVLENAKVNIAMNVPKAARGRVAAAEHLWGCVDDKLSRGYESKFDVVMAAGCLDQETQHVNVARTVAHFLKKDEDATVYVINGFNLGREKLRSFFQVVFEQGLSVITMFEQDATGERRDCYVDCSDSKEEILERGWLLVAQLGWHVEEEEEEEIQIEFKNLDNGTSKRRGQSRCL